MTHYAAVNGDFKKSLSPQRCATLNKALLYDTEISDTSARALHFFLLSSVSGEWAQWWEEKLCKNVISETVNSCIAVETFFKAGVQLFLSVVLTSAVRGVCRHAYTCLLGGHCGGSTGCSVGYVWEWGSKVLAGLSRLLMAAIDWTTRILSACALHTTSHLPHWHLAASPAWVTLLPTQDGADAFCKLRQHCQLPLTQLLVCPSYNITPELSLTVYRCTIIRDNDQNLLTTTVCDVKEVMMWDELSLSKQKLKHRTLMIWSQKPHVWLLLMIFICTHTQTTTAV